MTKKGVTIWFTGLSGAEKTTISQGLADRLRHQFNIEPVVLDGDSRSNSTAIYPQSEPKPMLS
jgi:adenylylsulfate kinase-like enzyme